MGFLSDGKKKELEFSKNFKKVLLASDKQDIEEHWDFCVRYDVKMIKRVLRDGEYNENIHWVEIKNVNGEKGWLYGDADYFTFEINDYWVVVEKDVLQKFIKNMCGDKEYCKSPEAYKLYSREGRKDVITLVKTIDLIAISIHLASK